MSGVPVHAHCHAEGADVEFTCRPLSGFAGTDVVSVGDELSIFVSADGLRRLARVINDRLAAIVEPEPTEEVHA